MTEFPSLWSQNNISLCMPDFLYLFIHQWQVLPLSLSCNTPNKHMSSFSSPSLSLSVILIYPRLYIIYHYQLSELCILKVMYQSVYPFIIVSGYMTSSVLVYSCPSLVFCCLDTCICAMITLFWPYSFLIWVDTKKHKVSKIAHLSQDYFVFSGSFVVSY